MLRPTDMRLPDNVTLFLMVVALVGVLDLLLMITLLGAIRSVQKSKQHYNAIIKWYTTRVIEEDITEEDKRS